MRAGTGAAAEALELTTLLDLEVRRLSAGQRRRLALARLIAQHLGPKLGTSVVVVNKAGASGVIGAQAVAQARQAGLKKIAFISDPGAKPL